MNCALATLALLTLQLGQPAPGWHADYASGLAEAKKTGKPIMLVLRCQP